MSELVWILLVVVVIVLIYIIYLYMTKKNVVLASTVYLNDKTAKTIENDKIPSPKSANFALGFWPLLLCQKARAEFLFCPGIDSRDRDGRTGIAESRSNLVCH